MKVPIFGGFPVENPTKKANCLKALLRGVALSEYGSEGFRVWLRRLSKYCSVAYLVERPTRETQAEQYSDTVRGFQDGGRGRGGREGVCSELGEFFGGGPKYFFSGPKRPLRIGCTRKGSRANAP